MSARSRFRCGLRLVQRDPAAGRPGNYRDDDFPGCVERGVEAVEGAPRHFHTSLPTLYRQAETKPRREQSDVPDLLNPGLRICAWQKACLSTLCTIKVTSLDLLHDCSAKYTVLGGGSGRCRKASETAEKFFHIESRDTGPGVHVIRGLAHQNFELELSHSASHPHHLAHIKNVSHNPQAAHVSQSSLTLAMMPSLPPHSRDYSAVGKLFLNLGYLLEHMGFTAALADLKHNDDIDRQRQAYVRAFER
ncbi:unnamed protein product [Diplocarpon coronariae]|nr:hypothetical protein JHW43_007238 [Diplocarpon mali]